MLEIPVFAVVMIGAALLGFGLFGGFIWSELKAERQVKAQEKEAEQQKMWKEYLTALKEGKNGR